MCQDDETIHVLSRFTVSAPSAQVATVSYSIYDSTHVEARWGFPLEAKLDQ